MSDEIRQTADLIHTQTAAPYERAASDAADLTGSAPQSSEPEIVSWPPPPSISAVQSAPAPVEPPDLSVCPACGRKLLSTRSILCNWCGSKIADVRYQQRAAIARAEADNAQRLAIEEDQRLVAQYGVWGKIKRTAKAHPPGSMLTPPKEDLKK